MEVLKLLKSSHILIDQIGLTPARLSVEGMATRNMVIGGNNSEISSFDNCPIIQCPNKKNDLKKLIKHYLENKHLIKENADLSYLYWKKNFSPDAFLKYFKELILFKAKKVKPFEFVPEIFYDNQKNFLIKLVLKIYYVWNNSNNS